LVLDDLRRDEDQQLRVLVVDFVALEQPAQKRDATESGRRAARVRGIADVDAADDGGLAVLDEHGRDGPLRVDGRNAVDRPAEVGRGVLEGDLHDDGVGGRNLRRHPERERRILEGHGHENRARRPGLHSGHVR